MRKQYVPGTSPFFARAVDEANKYMECGRIANQSEFFENSRW